MSTLSLRKIKHDSSASDNVQLNSNGNTSIATTNVANVPLEVGGSVALGRIANTAYSRFVGIGGSGGTFINGTTGGGYIEFTNDTSYNNEVHLITHWSGNQHGRTLSVDYKGRVTMPYQPAFNARLTTGNTSSTTTLVFNDVNINRGNYYNNTNGLFTAPVAGAYFFSARLRASSGDLNPIWVKNGTDLAYFGTSTTSVAGTYIVQMAAGDTFSVRNVGGTIQGVSDYHSVFNGCLLG